MKAPITASENLHYLYKYDPSLRLRFADILIEYNEKEISKVTINKSNIQDSRILHLRYTFGGGTIDRIKYFTVSDLIMWIKAGHSFSYKGKDLQLDSSETKVEL